MTIFQSTQSYASDVSLSYDEQRQRYIGEMISRGGVYRVEGIDRADVMYEVDGILRAEYQEMVRELSRGQGRSLGQTAGRGRGGGGSSNARPNDRVDGMPVYTRQVGELEKGGRGSFGSWVEYVMGALSLASGNYLEAGISAISLAMSDWYDGVESLWDKNPEPKIFSVSFGGIIITATSRKLLKKKLQRQKNKRIQRIMVNVYKHKRDQENSDSSPRSRSKAAERIRQKKRQAEALRPKQWEKRVSPQGRNKNLELKGKTMDLRNRIKNKRSQAQELWAQRLSFLAGGILLNSFLSKTEIALYLDTLFI